MSWFQVEGLKLVVSGCETRLDELQPGLKQNPALAFPET